MRYPTNRGSTPLAYILAAAVILMGFPAMAGPSPKKHPPPPPTVRAVAVTPSSATLADNAAAGIKVAVVSVTMSDGSPYTGVISVAPSGTLAVSAGNVVTSRALAPSDDGQHQFMMSAGGVTATFTLSVTASAPPPPAAAMRAYDFYSKFGANTNINSGQTVASILTDLQYIGVRNIRDSIYSEGYAQAFAALAAQGVKLHMDFQGWVNPAPAMSDWLAWLKNDLVTPYPGSVVGVSGPNEVDNTGTAFVYGGLSGIPAANKAQHDLFAGIKADPALAGIPVDMWPLAFAYSGNDAGQLSAIGDQTANCDRANLHDYYAADNYNQPTYPTVGDIQVSLQRYLLNVRQVCNRQNFVTTETGWYTPTQAGWQGSGANEYVQARLLLDDLFDHVMLPYDRLVYIFDLRGGTPDGDFSDPWYGVIHDDGTPKISGVAIRNLMTILNDTGAAAATFAAGTLNYSLSGMPAASGNFAIQKSSGTYQIILWNETPIWNNSTATQVAIPTSPVTVTLPAGSSGKVYNPIGGADPVMTFSGVSQVTVGLNDAPLVIEVN